MGLVVGICTAVRETTSDHDDDDDEDETVIELRARAAVFWLYTSIIRDYIIVRGQEKDWGEKEPLQQVYDIIYHVQ